MEIREYKVWMLIFALVGSLATTVGAQLNPAYEARQMEWRKSRAASLLSENGWLNLSGLLWLKPGRNSFGGDPANDLVFPGADARLGVFTYNEQEVIMELENGAQVYEEDQLQGRRQVWAAGQTQAPLLRHRSLRWTVIRRGDRVGIRLRDLEHPALKSFPGIEYFPLEEKWLLEAWLEPAQPGHTVMIQNVLGQISPEESPGTVVFEVDGKTHRLDAVWEGKRLFLIFSDATSGDTTYGGGRFLYADAPGPDGKILLDFNQAINPPCAFTLYATCPLPPRQNALDLAITAGEKTFGEH